MAPAGRPCGVPWRLAAGARLRGLGGRVESDLLGRVAGMRIVPARTWIIAYSHVPMGTVWPHVSVIPDDAEAFARALYSELHRADGAGVDWILVEALQAAPAWHGFAHRLQRAARS